MRILVCVNAVLDVTLPIRVDDGGRTLAQGLTIPLLGTAVPVRQPGAAARNALEFALALGTGKVVAVAVGGAEAEDVLVWCRARGVDDVLLIDTGHELWSPSTIATRLARCAKDLDARLVVCGANGERGGSGGVPASLATSLGWPLVDNVLSTTFCAEGGHAIRRLPQGWREEVGFPSNTVLAVELSSRAAAYVPVSALERAQARGFERLCDGEPPRDSELLSFAVAPGKRRKPLAADAGQSAADRIKTMLQIGSAAKKATERKQGDVDSQADGFIAFLREHRLLAGSDGQDN